MKNILILCLYLCVYLPSYSQKNDTMWTIGGDLIFNLQNVGLHNWSSGGETSISVSGNFLGYMIFDNGKNKWNNEINTTYGLIYQDISSYQLRKIDDQLIINTQYGWYFDKKWLLIVGSRFQTQYSNGYNYYIYDNSIEQRELISAFLSPGYITPMIGIEYTIKNTLNVTVSPLSGRFVIINNKYISTLGNYDVPIGKKSLVDFGVNYNIMFKKTLLKNIKVETTFNLFIPYNEPSQMKVNWESNIIMNINKWLKSSISTNLIYDDDVMINKKDGSIGPGIQFKYVFSLGFNIDIGEDR